MKITIELPVTVLGDSFGSPAIHVAEFAGSRSFLAQLAAYPRAAQTKRFNRKNTSTGFTFNASRELSNGGAAFLWLMDHLARCPELGTVTLSASWLGGLTQSYYLEYAALTITGFRLKGATVFMSYAISAGRLTTQRPTGQTL